MPLSEFVQLQRGFDLPYRNRIPGAYKVLSSGETSGSHSEFKVRGPGFVVGRATNIGRPTWSDDDYWPLNTVLFAKGFAGNDPKFAYYWFLATDLTAYNSGSVQPMLNRNYIANIGVDVPPIAEQRAIASTLGALDDKIESNRRIGRLSLALAVSTYERGCIAGCDDIPLKDAGRWMSGNTPRTSNDEYWGGDLPWISSASLRDFFVDNSDRRLTPAGAGAASNIAQPGTVLFVVRGMSLKSEFRIGIAQRPVAFGQDCKAIAPSIDPSVLGIGLWARRDEILDLVDEAGHGTGRLQTDRIERVAIRVPRDPGVAQDLHALIDRGAAAKRESRRLAALRDALLPELLSGRIRVAEAADAVTEATA